MQFRARGEHRDHAGEIHRGFERACGEETQPRLVPAQQKIRDLGGGTVPALLGLERMAAGLNGGLIAFDGARPSGGGRGFAAQALGQDGELLVEVTRRDRVRIEQGHVRLDLASGPTVRRDRGGKQSPSAVPEYVIWHPWQVRADCRGLLTNAEAPGEMGSDGVDLPHPARSRTARASTQTRLSLGIPLAHEVCEGSSWGPERQVRASALVRHSPLGRYPFPHVRSRQVHAGSSGGTPEVHRRYVRGPQDERAGQRRCAVRAWSRMAA